MFKIKTNNLVKKKCAKCDSMKPCLNIQYIDNGKESYECRVSNCISIMDHNHYLCKDCLEIINAIIPKKIIKRKWYHVKFTD